MSSKKKADLNKFKVVFGYTLLFISVILFTSFISYMYNWRVDQSSVDSLLDRNIQVENILGKIGASISHFLIFKLFGIASFIFPVILLISSYYLLFNKKILELIKKINWLLLLIVWTTLLSGYLSNYFPIQSGIVGFEINSFLETYIGNIGIILIIGFIFVLSIAILWNITPYSLFTLLKNTTLINKQKEKSFDDDAEEKTYPDLNLEESLDLFNAHSEQTKSLMIDKNHDYGEAWRDMRVSSLTDLILQKLLRVKQIEDNKGETLVSEGIDANYQDIVNYAVFALIHLKE